MPTPTPSLARRILAALTPSAWRRQSFELPYPLDAKPSVGVSTVGARGYSPLKAMSAFAAFPTVFAAANAISLDLSGLPLKVREVGPDGKRHPLNDHPFLDLMRQPSPGMTELRLRRQMHLDEALTARAIWHRRNAFGVTTLRRLHPEHADPTVNSWGDILSWKYGAVKGQLPASSVFFVSGPSWSDRLDGVLAEAPIRALDLDLQAAQSAKKHAKLSADRGRPVWHFSAPENSPLVSEDAMDLIVERFDQMVSQGLPAFFTASGMKAEKLSYSMEDLALPALVAAADAAALVVMGVPAVRLGSAGADYGMAKVQMRMHWESMAFRARMFDDALTPLAQDMDPKSGRRVEVYHDMSSIEALQPSYDLRQNRAAIWVNTFGATPEEAVRFERFEGAPVGKVAPGATPRRPAKEVGEAQEARQGMTDLLALALRNEARDYDRARAGGEEAMDEVREDYRKTYSILLGMLDVDETTRETMSSAWAHGQRELAHHVDGCENHPSWGSVRARQLVGPVASLASEHHGVDG